MPSYLKRLSIKQFSAKWFYVKRESQLSNFSSEFIQWENKGFHWKAFFPLFILLSRFPTLMKLAQKFKSIFLLRNSKWNLKGVNFSATTKQSTFNWLICHALQLWHFEKAFSRCCHNFLTLFMCFVVFLP